MNPLAGLTWMAVSWLNLSWQLWAVNNSLTVVAGIMLNTAISLLQWISRPAWHLQYRPKRHFCSAQNPNTPHTQAEPHGLIQTIHWSPGFALLPPAFPSFPAAASWSSRTISSLTVFTAFSEVTPHFDHRATVTCQNISWSHQFSPEL